MQKIKKNIEETVNAGLCTGCGTCAGLCPNSSIYMDKTGDAYIPKLNKNKCNQCGICFEVCPGHSVDFKKLNLVIFGRNKQNTLLGNYINCYIGHAADPNTRYNSSSGGLITELLIFAVEEGIIDGALITKMNNAHPLEPEVFIGRTKDEIVSASKSKYCPVPVNIALKDVLDENGRFATVGLPCHIHGIRKAEMINKKLAEKIVLHLGLICHHTPTFSATAYLLQKMKLKKQDIEKIDYRGEGWPGGMSITLKNGKKRFIHYSNPFYWGHVFNSYFFPRRCLLCTDKICELSDISLGDAWRLSNGNVGSSLIISRTKTGEELLEKAAVRKKIEIEKVNNEEVLESQALDLTKRLQEARILIFKKLGKRVPVYNQDVFEPKTSDYIKSLLLCLQVYISSKRHLWNIIDIYPSFVARIKRSFTN